MKKQTLRLFFGTYIRMTGFLFISFLAVSANADVAALADADYGIEIGVRSQSGDVEGGSFSTASQTTAQFGGVIHFPVSGKLFIRTGMLYTQRPLIVTGAGIENKIKMNYLDVPLALLFNFEDHAGVFAGVSLGMNLDKSCDLPNCKLSEVKNLMVPLIFGASFKFAPQFGATIYFESYGDTVAKSPVDNYSLTNYRAVGANLFITFN